MKLIYPLLQRNVAYIGFIDSVHTNHGTSHHGCYSDTIKTFNVGGVIISGDFGTMAFTAKNCLKFDTIHTKYNHNKTTNNINIYRG